MSLFDLVADEFFERRIGLDPANHLHLADLARRHGATEAEVRSILSGRLMPGQSFGGARTEDPAWSTSTSPAAN